MATKDPKPARTAKPKAAAPKVPFVNAAEPAETLPAPLAAPVIDALPPVELPEAPALAAAPEPMPAAPALETAEAVGDALAEITEVSVETIQHAAPAVEAAPAPQEEVIMATNPDTFNTAPADKAKALFADVNDRTKVAVERSTKLVEEFTELNKGHVEAVVESSKIAAKGFESMGQEAADYSRRSFEQATAAMKNLAAAKSPTEFFKLHSDYVRSAFDQFVAETSKNTEAALKLAGEVAQPISNRVAVVVEKAKVAA